MALRSVVLNPSSGPSAPRRAVILRAGSPTPKGDDIDVIIGIVGVLTLLSCVALAQVLPDKTYINPQFRLSFLDGGGEGNGTQSAAFTEGTAESMDFQFYVPEFVVGAGATQRRIQNIFSVTVTVFVEDDITYSLPDRFSFVLLDPAGNVVGDPSNVVETPRPRPDGASFSASPIQVIFNFPILEHPQEQIITGKSPSENAVQALARIEPEYRVSNAGVWTVRATLEAAGNCPEPQDPEFNALQAFHCRVDDPNNPDDTPSSDGRDLGNVFSVQNFVWSYYVPVVEELK